MHRHSAAAVLLLVVFATAVGLGSFGVGAGDPATGRGSLFFEGAAHGVSDVLREFFHYQDMLAGFAHSNVFRTSSGFIRSVLLVALASSGFDELAHYRAVVDQCQYPYVVPVCNSALTGGFACTSEHVKQAHVGERADPSSCRATARRHSAGSASLA